jgi:TPR repeat protein
VLAPQEINQIQRVQEVEAKQQAEKNQASQNSNLQLSQIPTKDSREPAKTDDTAQSVIHETQIIPGESGQQGIIIDSGTSARTLIKQIRQGEKSLTLEKIYAQAAQFEQQSRATDAYLLYFYAARQGHGLSAFALATMNDPAYFTGNNDLLDKADPVQAHKWYSIAAAAQVAEAETRLTNLRSSIEAAATAGDQSAQRLLLNWK